MSDTPVYPARWLAATRRISLVLLIAGVGVLPACSAGTDPPVVFQYDLTTIGGQPLPFELQSALADRINVTGTLLVLEPDGTYSLTILTEILDAGELTTNSSGEIGDWTQSGSQVALVSRFEDKTTTASIQGGTMTIAAYAITLFFGENDSDAFVLSGLTLVERQGQSP